MSSWRPGPLNRLSLDERFSRDGQTLIALAVVTLVALVIRLWDLGGRVMHWDEGRVGYWTLRYAETGEFAYAPIIHGPFLRIVNASMFGLLPPTDGVARLIVALVGGLLPLAAWLFREHLDRGEVLALGVILAANPLLVYYSRFMRNDVLVGGFALIALGFAVRALDTRRVLYLYPGAVFLALSLTTKANTLLYTLCFLGAGVLVLDHRFVRAVRDGAGVRGALRGWWTGIRDEVRSVAGGRHPAVFVASHLVGLTVTFLAIIVFFYAPRPALYQAVSAPGMWPGVLHEATIGSAEKLADLWLSGDMQDNPYLQFVGHELETLIYTSAPLLVLALVGAVVDWYGRRGGAVPIGRNRAFVAFSVYWGLASLVGYPAATDINAPWSAVHIVIPLSIPAAVGLTYLAREGIVAYASLDDDSVDRVTLALVGLVLLVVAGGVVGANASYWNSTDADQSEMVQWAQPHNDVRSTLEDVEAIAATHEGDVDILFVGTDLSTREGTFYVADESAADDKGAPGGWYDRLPLPWYYERADATVDSIPPDADREAALEDAPPVVIVHEDDRTSVEPHLDGYRATEHQLRLWGFNIVFYVDEAELDAARDAE